MKQYPYVFPYFGYDETSAGNVLIHKFCHLINELGGKAYMATDITHPDLNTPKINNIQGVDDKCIVVSPENINHLTYGGDYIVKYIQADYEKIGRGKVDLAGVDDVWCFAKTLFPKHWGGEVKVCHFNTVDLSLFNEDEKFERKGNICYVGRMGGKVDTSILKDMKDLTAITHDFPKDRKDLIKLMRSSEWCYIFSNTSIGSEAIMCGCPVVMHENFSMAYAFDEYGEDGKLYGMAIGNSLEQMEWAKKTVKKFQEKVYWHESQKEKRVLAFMEDTQKGLHEKLLG